MKKNGKWILIIIAILVIIGIIAYFIFFNNNGNINTKIQGRNLDDSNVNNENTRKRY